MGETKTKIENKGQGTLFENTFLEFLTKAPPAVSATLYFSIILLMFYRGVTLEVVDTWVTAIAVYSFAVFFWTFFEYFFHKYINHIDEYFPESEWAHTLAYTLHGIHHEYPRDKERLIMPPVPGLMIVSVLYLVFAAIMGNMVYVFMPGFMTGYLMYTYVHFSTHKSNVPSFLKTQYRHHALHHYKYPDRAFGVSTTLWDRVFGTMPPED